MNLYLGGVSNAVRRCAGASQWFGLIAVALVMAGAFGAGFGLWPFGPGLLMVAAGFLLSLFALGLGLFAAARNRSGSGLGPKIVIGMLGAVAALGSVGPWVYRGFAYPPIHDVSTDLANPPSFTVLPPRKDNLAGVGTIAAWQALHAKAYGDIQPLTIAIAPDVAITHARAYAQAQGWTIAPTAADRLEATETVSPFRFKDDVVVTAIPAPGGSATVVNIRSVSRVGVSDFGLNAARVRALRAAIANDGKG